MPPATISPRAENARLRKEGTSGRQMLAALKAAVLFQDKRSDKDPGKSLELNCGVNPSIQVCQGESPSSVPSAHQSLTDKETTLPGLQLPERILKKLIFPTTKVCPV